MGTILVKLGAVNKQMAFETWVHPVADFFKRYGVKLALVLLLLIGFTSCTEQKSNSKLVINEVLVDNQTNFQDDYGVHSGWIEIFNKAYSTADLAGCLRKWPVFLIKPVDCGRAAP